MISWKNGSAVAMFHRSSCSAANPVAVAVKAEVQIGAIPGCCGEQLPGFGYSPLFLFRLPAEFTATALN